ncbi:MAG TPA: hypothetical protein VMQ11_19510, partial [Alphaproteobacteria bacterium]|nr:hypothetical protein [Alphaproteobacteria bacterium]
MVDFLFDKPGRNASPETFFESVPLFAFHVFFVFGIASAYLVATRWTLAMLLVGVIAYLTFRSIKGRHRGAAGASTPSGGMIAMLGEFLHRNFALLFSGYLAVLGPSSLPSPAMLAGGAAIDLWREWRIQVRGSGSSTDL